MQSGSRAAFFLGAAQHLPDCAAQLGPEWGLVRRRHLPIHVVATGSSALVLGAGSQECLASRFERLRHNRRSTRDLAGAFGLRGVDTVAVLVGGRTVRDAHAYRTDPRGAPDGCRGPEWFGPRVENARQAHCANTGQHVTYWRPGAWEVDGVLERGWRA